VRIGDNMPLAAITKQGLISIAILTAVLWTCLFTERRLVRYSKIETYRSLRDMRHLKMMRRVEPASSPAPVREPSARPAIG
jgi:hypothetical protein